MDRVRVAVVGCGGMGREHAFGYIEMRDSVDLRWVVDPDVERAQKLAGEVGCHYAEDLEAVLDDVDAVSICTPHHLHASLTVATASAGKHVLVEKPMANSREECLSMIRAAEDAKVVLMVGYILRYSPVFLKLKEVLEREEFGPVFNINCWTEHYMLKEPSHWISKRETLGGGVLFSHGCHYIDLLLWYLGNPKRVVYSGTRLGSEWLEGEGTAHTIIKFESGALGYYECSWAMRHSELGARIHAHCRDALLVLQMGTRRLEAITPKDRKTIYQEEAVPQRGHGIRPELEHFIHCIGTGETPWTNGRDAMRSLEVIWEAYRGEEL